MAACDFVVGVDLELGRAPDPFPTSLLVCPACGSRRTQVSMRVGGQGGYSSYRPCPDDGAVLWLEVGGVPP